MARSKKDKIGEADQRYFFKTLITDVYDGDSVTAEISLGWDIKLAGQKIRLSGINTPEVRGKTKEEGIVVRDFVRGLILDKEVYMKVSQGRRKGKYGRWLGVIYFEPNDEGTSLNQMLIDNAMAVPYMV